MKELNTTDIRDVVILGGSGSGKTTLTEAAAFASGKINRLGSVLDGNTISDYDKQEKKRGFSIGLSVVPVMWNGYKINFLDTPGGIDFSGEREAAAETADAAVIVINGKRGIDNGTLTAWKLCDKYKLPRIIFVTAMDDDNASYRQIVEDLTQNYGNIIAPFHMPIRKEQRLIGYADITRMKGRKFDGIGKFEDIDIPDYCMDYLKKYKDILDEAVASVDEDSMNKFFNGEEFTQTEMDAGLRTDCVDGSIVPVTMGSGLHVHGVCMLMDCITRYMPAPYVIKTGINVKTNDLFDCYYNKNSFLVARVFKTISDPYIGRYSLVKVYSGELKPDMNIFNAVCDIEQRIGRIYYISGSEAESTDRIIAGDIGAVPKLNNIFTNDTLSTKEVPIKFTATEYETPYTYKRIVSDNKADEDKITPAVMKLIDEDVTLKTINDKDNSQLLIAGIGEQQLSVFEDKLKEKYNLKIHLEAPKIAYKETICSEVTVRGRYKKQSGGHGQFGDVVMTFGPSGDREQSYVFEENIVGGAVPKNYFSAVEKGVQESIRCGLLAGYPVVGVKAVLTDGSYHPVDSSDNAFKMAAMMAFKEAYFKAEPIILEPIAAVKIYVPSKYTGDVISDLKSRRARVIGMVPQDDGDSYIQADIPMELLDGYLARLRSISGGSGRIEYEFSRYGKAPDDVVKRLEEAYKG